jgi:hypothetical protein
MRNDIRRLGALPMEHDYTALGLSLDAGSWADWFAGTMSLGAVVTALMGYWVVHRQRVADLNDREKRVAESVGWNALQTFNDTATIAKHLKESLEADVDVRFQGRKFARVRPLGIPSKPTADLNQEEVGLLLKARAPELLMELQDAIARYDSIRFAMQEYKSRHEALYQLMPTPIATDGARMAHELTREEHDKVTPYAVMLDVLLESIIDLVAEGVEKGASLLILYGGAVKVYFGAWHLEFSKDVAVADLTVFRSMPLDRSKVSP